MNATSSLVAGPGRTHWRTLAEWLVPMLRAHPHLRAMTLLEDTAKTVSPALS